MRDLIESWRGLSRPWKTFTVALPILLVFFTMAYNGNVPVALLTSLVWAAAAASLVRMRDRLRNR